MIAYSQAGYIVSFNYNDKILNSSSSYEFIMFSGSLLIFCCRFLKNFSKGVEGLSKKEKGLMGMDNRVVIAVGRGYETKW